MGETGGHSPGGGSHFLPLLSALCNRSDLGLRPSEEIRFCLKTSPEGFSEETPCLWGLLQRKPRDAGFSSNSEG